MKMKNFLKSITKIMIVAAVAMGAVLLAEKAPATAFAADNPRPLLTNTGGETWSALQQEFNSGGDIQLTCDYTAGSSDTALVVPSKKTVTLDLNGHTIDRALTEPKVNGNVITVNGTLTIKDSPGGGKIKGGNSIYDPEKTSFTGGIFVSDKGSLKLEGGTICNNIGDSWCDGGGVHVYSGGSFAMSGGTISGNEAGGGGGVFKSNNTGEFEMSGGTICSNRARNGGGIYCTEGTVIMTNNAIITGNTALGYSAVYANALNMAGSAKITNNYCTKEGKWCAVYSTSTVSLSGNVQITGNTNVDNQPRNVGPLATNQKLTIAGKLDSSARIGVTSTDTVTGDNPKVFTSGLPGRGTASNFTSDEGYIVELNSEGEAVLTDYTVISIPTAAADLKWTGSEQTGVSAGTGYTVKDGKGTNAGSYIAVATLTSTTNFRWSDGTTEAKEIPWSIAKVDPDVAPPSPKENLKYTGSAQSLIIAGSVTGGTMYYAVTDSAATQAPDFDGTSTSSDKKWSTAIPAATDPGTYKVWYKVMGDINHNDTEAVSLSVTIGGSALEARVPLTESGGSYASSEDNFAAEIGSGKLKGQVLDFSKVSGSNVDPAGLNLTAVNGSKYSTKGKLKDKDSAKVTGGVKVKVNKKTLIATITCKKDGSVTLTMEDGSTYTITFKVQKPKAQKSAKNLSKGSAPVTKTIKDLFGTDIDSGKLTIIKETTPGQAAITNNKLIVDPTEKDSIKLLYEYLDKKYKITVKVK